jgi:alpha-D-ribose 1-methylphosphonate 5-triphosphate diphosphatase
MSMIFANARLVLPDEIVPGWLAVANGRIVEMGEGRAPERGLDLASDYLAPGLVELHTDSLEGHVNPRPKVRWNLAPAVLAYDAGIASAGITTVFDSLRVGTEDTETLGGETEALADAIDDARRLDILRAQHFTHLRCEICTDDVLEATEAFLARHPARLLSLMDHTPGQRQFRDVEKLLVYYRGKGRSEEALQELVVEKRARHRRLNGPHRAALVALARRHQLPVASHDDATLEDVAEAVRDGVSVAEFPVTPEAAEASRAAGIRILMGAPNLVRGGSHSGNVAAEELARAGLLDILSSDYIPASLIQAAFELPRRVPSITLPRAIATVTRAPAEATGLLDRGRLAPGLRADLVRIRDAAGLPVVRGVWREGERVA